MSGFSLLQKGHAYHGAKLAVAAAVDVKKHPALINISSSQRGGRTAIFLALLLARRRRFQEK